MKRTLRSLLSRLNFFIFLFFVSINVTYTQSVTCEPKILNTPGYPEGSQSNTQSSDDLVDSSSDLDPTTNSLRLDDLNDGLFDFTATLTGGGNNNSSWGNGVQIQEDSEIFGDDYIYLQPVNVDDVGFGNGNGTNDNAQY